MFMAVKNKLVIELSILNIDKRCYLPMYSQLLPRVDEMKHATITAVLFLLAITQGSAEFQCPLATFVELGKGVVIDCLISDVNDIYWLRGTEEDHYPIVKIEMGRKTISKVAQDHFDITDTGALVIRDASNDLTGSYVMLHYRTYLVREVDTVTLNVTTLVDSIIIQGPSGGVYPMGSNITLTCIFQKGYVVGWKEYENKDIFVADTKVTADTKYDNFRVSLSDRISNLQIIGAELEDAGKYSCNTESYAHVEIEAPPTLRIICNVTDDEDTYSPESHDVIDIVCTARNAKPAVMIRFKTDGTEWINPSETWTVSKGMTFDTSATLKYNVRKNQNDVFLTCQAFGQKTVPPMEKTIHLFTPNCSLDISNTEATCSCISNPPVYKYIISIDGKQEVGKTLNVENLGGSTISCIGVNYIGVGISTSRVVESINDSSFPVNVVIIVVVILVAVIAFVVVYRWRKKHKSQANANQRESTNDSIKKGGVSPCSVRKTTDNSNDVAPEREKLLAQSSPAKSERFQIPWNKGSPAESERSQIPWNKEHNHGSFKSTDTENRNAQRDNQHGAAGTPTASENKRSKEASNRAKNKEENKNDENKDEWKEKYRAVIRNIGQYHASPEHTAVQSTVREHNHGSFKSTDTENVNTQRDNQHGAASTATDSENKKQPLAGFVVTGNVFQSHASPEQSAFQSAQRGQEAIEDIDEISRQRLVGLHSKAEESEDSASIPEAPNSFLLWDTFLLSLKKIEPVVWKGDLLKIVNVRNKRIPRDGNFFTAPKSGFPVTLGFPTMGDPQRIAAQEL